ncbi:MAG: twin-arginine translocase TatA/TatE family subunit [Candidatus Poseidoniales archaeon]|tara:strand:- start:63 stop:332 length:270 start_codon:yes stop_codon:yes gene_type:complete
MNSPGLIELFVIVFLFWVLLGPNKVMEGARLLGKAYREFRGYGTGIVSENPEISKKEKIRASAERLGIDTAGMDTSEIKKVMVDELSNE